MLFCEKISTMQYYFSKTLDTSFEEAIDKVTASLKEDGFGILTEIDVSATMKEKLDKDMAPYRILGACNPQFAYKAIQAENKIGTMLPCNVIVQQRNGKVEVSAVNPIASMQAIENPDLGGVATQVRDMLKQVIERL